MLLNNKKLKLRKSPQQKLTNSMDTSMEERIMEQNNNHLKQNRQKLKQHNSQKWNQHNPKLMRKCQN